MKFSISHLVLITLVIAVGLDDYRRHRMTKQLEGQLSRQRSESRRLSAELAPFLEARNQQILNRAEKLELTGRLQINGWNCLTFVENIRRQSRAPQRRTVLCNNGTSTPTAMCRVTFPVWTYLPIVIA